MRKFSIIFLALLMCLLAFASCGKDDKDDGKDTTGDTVVTTAAPDTGKPSDNTEPGAQEPGMEWSKRY